jgi:hypothetical protein
LRKWYVRVEDMIEILEYAKWLNSHQRYRIYADRSNVVWYETMIEHYDDKTYQVYFILNKSVEEEHILWFLKNTTYHQDVKNLTKLYLDMLNEWKRLKLVSDSSELEKFWKKNHNSIKETIQAMDGINLDSLY